MESSIIDKMQQFPMLQGLTLDEFHEILAHINLDFCTYDEGETIVHQGDSCTRLIYIIEGTYEAKYSNIKDSFTVTEELSAATPVILEMHNLFSIKRRYERTYTFKSKGLTFAFSKEQIYQKLLSYPIVRNNIIYMLSNQLYKEHQKTYFNLPENIEERMAAFVRSYVSSNKGLVKVDIGMDTLSTLIDEARLKVSKVLNAWNEQGIIELKRRGFIVPDITRLP